MIDWHLYLKYRRHIRSKEGKSNGFEKEMQGQNFSMPMLQSDTEEI